MCCVLLLVIIAEDGETCFLWQSTALTMLLSGEIARSSKQFFCS